MSTKNTCGTAEIAMHFEESDIVISPFELDIFKEHGKLDNARARISREAGDLIDDKSFEREPVSIYSENEVIARMFYPDEGLEISMEDAHLKLYDDLQIAQYAEIDKSFSGSWSIGDIVDYLFTRIEEEDEYNVLKDWRSSNIDENEERYTVEGPSSKLDVVQHIDEAGQSLGLSDSQIVSFGNWAEGKVRNRYGFLKDDVDFDYEGETALKVLYEVAEEFGIDVFTKDDGILWIGSEEDEMEVYVGSFPPSTYNLINYSVPASNNRVQGVVVDGGSVRTLMETLSANIWDIVKGDDKTDVYGVAVRTDVDEGNIVAVDHDSDDPDALTQIAENKLREIVANEKSGNAQIDLLSSNLDEMDQPDIRSCKIGDVLIVPDQSGLCQRVRPGEYMIDSVHHQLNPRQGWVINLGIRQIIFQGIDTGAFGYSRADEEVVEKFGDYGVGFSWGDQEIGGISGKGIRVHNQEMDSDYADYIE